MWLQESRLTGRGAVFLPLVKAADDLGLLLHCTPRNFRDRCRHHMHATDVDVQYLEYNVAFILFAYSI